MGSNTNECIVDSDRKVYGFENVYVCDASVFPTAVGVNPQLTVMALATMTANKIINNWQETQDLLSRTSLMDKKKIATDERPAASDTSSYPTALNTTVPIASSPKPTSTPTEKTTTAPAASEGSPLGITCHISQPRFCTGKAIGDLYAVRPHNSDLFPKLENCLDETRVIGKNWKFNPKTLKIYNDLYWKGMEEIMMYLH